MECIKSQLKFWALEGCLAHFLPKATFEFGITQTWTSELALFLCTIFKALPKQSDSWKSALCRNPNGKGDWDLKAPKFALGPSSTQKCLCT